MNFFLIFATLFQAESEMKSVLRDNYTAPIEAGSQAAKTLGHRHWGELLYHLHRLMQRGSLMENYAIRKLQQLVITQVM